MGNLQTLYVKTTVNVGEWWPAVPDNANDILIPNVDGKFVATFGGASPKARESINLQLVLDHWDELADATWMVREWQCNPCGTGVDWSKVPPPREKEITGDQAKEMICNGL